MAIPENKIYISEEKCDSEYLIEYRDRNVGYKPRRVSIAMKDYHNTDNTFDELFPKIRAAYSFSENPEQVDIVNGPVPESEKPSFFHIIPEKKSFLKPVSENLFSRLKQALEEIKNQDKTVMKLAASSMMIF